MDWLISDPTNRERKTIRDFQSMTTRDLDLLCNVLRSRHHERIVYSLLESEKRIERREEE